MIDAITLDQLRVFIAIADVGSFRGAAAKLARAQSAISFAVANLEAQLSLTLFDRTQHRPMLTREGAALLEDARTIVGKAAALRARSRSFKLGLEIALVLAVDTLFPPDVVAEALGALYATHPSVSVRVLSSTLGGPIDAVCAREAAFGVTLSDELRDPAVDLVAIGRVPMIAVAASGSELAKQSLRAPLSSAEIGDVIQIVVSDPSSRTARQDLGVASHRTWRVGSLELKSELIQQGVGWGRLPRHIAQPLLDGGALTRLRLRSDGDAEAAGVPAYLARRRDHTQGPAEQLLCEILVGLAGSRSASRAPPDVAPMPLRVASIR